MVTLEDVQTEIEGLYQRTQILINNYNEDMINNNPLHLQVNLDIIISNCNIIKGLMSLHMGLKQQKGSQFNITK